MLVDVYVEIKMGVSEYRRCIQLKTDDVVSSQNFNQLHYRLGSNSHSATLAPI